MTDTKQPAGYGQDKKGSAGGAQAGQPGCPRRPIKFTLDGREVEAPVGETISALPSARHQAAASVLLAGARLPRRRQLPRLHGRDRGRAGAGRKLHSQADRRHEGQDQDRPRQDRAPDGVELLVTDQPERDVAHDPQSKFWQVGRRAMGVAAGRFPSARRSRGARPQPYRDGGQSRRLHPVQSAASAPAAKCRSTTSSAWPAAATPKRSCSTSTIRWAHSTCVACGECVQACPTGALMPATLVDEHNVRTGYADREVDSVCPYCGVGCQLTYHIKDDKLLYVTGKDGPANQQPALRQGPVRLRLRAQSAAPDPAADPQGRRRRSRRRRGRSAPIRCDAFPRSHLGRGARPRRRRLEEDPRPQGRPRARRLRLGQGLERGGLSVPEAGAHRLRLQQRRSLHPAVPRLLGGGADGRRRLRRGDGDLQRVQELRRHHRDRRQPDREPSGRRDLLQAGGQARRQADRDGPARPGAQAPRRPHAAVQQRHRRGDAQRACST